MIELKLNIDEITTENNNGNEKKILSGTYGESEKVFIEFQGKHQKKLKTFKQGDSVWVMFRFNGKVSKIGRRYNNLIGISIKNSNN
jgi:hypothetical protein